MMPKGGAFQLGSGSQHFIIYGMRSARFSLVHAADQWLEGRDCSHLLAMAIP